jgi:hypothetical protein
MRDHCCNDIAKSAYVRLITRLKNQSEFTQMAYLGGENGARVGMERVEGVGVGGRAAFGLARI